MVYGICNWDVVYWIWKMVYGTWDVVNGTRDVVNGTWNASGIRRVGYGSDVGGDRGM